MNISVRRQLTLTILLKRGMLLLALLVSSYTQASVLLLLSSDASYYQETAEAIKTSLREQSPPPEIRFATASLQNPGWENALNQEHQLIVAIGSNATKSALQLPGDTPLLSIFIPKNAFDALHVEQSADRQRPVSVIYLDQPLCRVVSLASLLQPEATRYGAVFGPISRVFEEELKSLTAKQGIALAEGYLGHEDNPVAVLRPLVQDSDVFIALPDQAILNRAIAKWILHLGFQQKVPVIGFSRAYTSAGALASIYTAPEDVGRQAGEMIAAASERDWSQPPQMQYPRYFTLSTNPAVARSLGINLPPENEIYRRIEQEDQEPR